MGRGGIGGDRNNEEEEVRVRVNKREAGILHSDSNRKQREVWDRREQG